MMLVLICLMLLRLVILIWYGAFLQVLALNMLKYRRCLCLVLLSSVSLSLLLALFMILLSSFIISVMLSMFLSYLVCVCVLFFVVGALLSWGLAYLSFGGEYI